MEVLCRLS